MIISFYSADVRRIQAEMSDDKGQLPPGLRIRTVDTVQGAESKIVIIHQVRATVSPRLFGFIAVPSRQNVATSRASLFQFIVGNFTAWKKVSHQFGLATMVPLWCC